MKMSRSPRAALVVSMHCLVLYCYLLASTKRGNESEGPPPPRRARLGSHNNIAPFRPPPTRRPRPHTNSRAAGRGRARAVGRRGGAVPWWYPRRRYLPLLLRRRRRIPQFGQMAVGGKLVRSKTVATLWLLGVWSRHGSRLMAA